MNRLVACFFVLLSAPLWAQVPFEYNIVLEPNSEITQIEPMGNQYLVQMKGTHPLFLRYEYRGYSAQGEQIWQLNEGFAFNAHANACVRDDGSAVLFVYDYGCDYFTNLFQVIIINANGEVEQNFIFDDMDSSPLVGESYYTTFLKSPNELVIVGYGGFQVFNLTEGTMSTLVFLDPIAMPMGGLRISDTKIALYDEQQIIQYDFMTEQNYSFLFPVPIQSVSFHGNELYALGEDQISKFDLSGMATGVTYLTEEGCTYLPKVNWNSTVLMTIVQKPNGDKVAKIYSEVLNELGTFELADAHLFSINSFANGGDQYWVGGKNSATDLAGSRALLKSYPFFDEPLLIQQDIGVTNVEFSNLYFYEIAGPPGLHNYGLVGDVEVTVTNFSEEDVYDWSVHANLDVYVHPWCSNAIEFRQSNTVIPVNESRTLTMQSMPIGSFFNLEDAQVVEYTFCVTSLGPNGMLDDVPTNDALCENASIVFTALEEVKASPFACIIKNESIEWRCHEDVQFCLFDVQGKILCTGKKNAGTHEIGTVALPSGVYALTLASSSSFQTIRFTK